MPSRPRAVPSPIGVEPDWYKDAIIYELHVRSYADSTGDGTGDFIGLTGKLDYLRDLGVTALWLLPFYPSPLRDDGYDISDYTNVHPSYGTLRDFRGFLREAHDRGIRVITELVLNHSSDQHPWFQRARRATTGSTDRNYYVWSDTPDKFTGARVIFRDFETSNWAWDPLAKAYYFHRFYSHQPDLNYDHPPVVRSMFRVIDFWMEAGVDGLRLDAVPYLFKREGTNCENLPETHQFLKQLRRHVDERFPSRMLLAEANQWPEDAAAYFGSGHGDECHAAFHFPLMPRLFMATRTERRFPVVDVLKQTPPIPPDAQWLLFLRNHDELTLEMVSDEERDYMYRVYAVDHRMRVNVGIRRRLAPLLNNDRRLIELMNGLLFALPGTPVLYYGDEIGMGDNIYLGDRNGVRTPMQWSADKNAGFSRANPQRLPLPIIIDPEYHYEAINVEAQQGNPRSLLWHMKRLIALRKQVGILGRAGTTLLYPDNPRVLAFVRGDGSRKILIVANLSHLVQHAELDLTAYRGLIPVELLGRSEFPPLDDRPSAFTLGPYDFFWFSLNAPTPAGLSPLVRTAPVLRAEGSWPILEEPGIRSEIENLIPSYLLSRRWFRAKALIPRGARLRPLLTVGRDELLFRVGLVDVEFSDVEPQLYTLPLAFAEGAHATELKKSDPGSVLAEFRPEGNAPERLLYDASQDPEFVRFLVDQMRHNRTHRVDGGEMVASRTSQFNGPDLPSLADLPITSIKAEQSNSSVRIGDRFIFKLYRAIGGGINPEREIGLFLLRQETPAPAALVAGSLDYLQEGRDPETLAVVHRWIPNEGDAWTMTLDHLREFFERIRAHLAGGQSLPVAASTKLEIALSEPPAIAIELVGTYLENARLLGVRTADLHKILGNDASDPAFAPEPYDQLYVRSIYQTMQTYRSEVFDLLRNRRPTFSPNVQALADSILAHEEGVEARYRALLGRKFGGQRIRIHGDYHLGQVLWTGKDFVIIDFEGEPLRALSERRIKRYPLRDVAGMLRSFDYAANAALRVVETTGGTPELREGLAGAGKLWLAWVSSVFLAAYRKEMHGSRFLTSDPAELQTLMNAYLFEKAVYELRYELNNRPDWVEVPLLGLRYLLGIQA